LRRHQPVVDPEYGGTQITAARNAAVALAISSTEIGAGCRGGGLYTESPRTFNRGENAALILRGP